VFGDVPLVEPDADDEPPLPVPTRTPEGKPKPEAPPRRHSPKARNPRRQDDSKPVANVGGDELAYWLSVFGDPSVSSSAASAGELSLSDLENWLKDFEATGRDSAKKHQ
jgi:hypothetical protein